MPLTQDADVIYATIEIAIGKLGAPSWECDDQRLVAAVKRIAKSHEQGKWLRAVVGGHFRYYGVPMNQPALALFRFRVGWYWHRSLSRRSQNGRVRWDRMRRLITRWLPLPSVCHPYPLRRMGVIT